MPAAALLLPAPLERFTQRDHAEDLLGLPGFVAVGPPRVPWGVLGRLPPPLAAAAAGLRLPADTRVLVMYHAFQWPVVRALLRRRPGAELWYARWDRYEEAYDAGPRTRAWLRRLHAAAARRADLVFAVSEPLVEQERAAVFVGVAADRFPAPDPGAAVVAISLGHLGRRTDWALLRGVVEGMPELVLLLVGAWHDEESGGDPDYAACRRAPNVVWLGRRDDEEAARLILCADVGVLPFERSAFNDAGLPFRVLKYARLGRRTIALDLPGVRVWPHAVTVAPDAAAWIAALRAHAGARTRPDAGLRAWALEQTAAAGNRPLRERWAALSAGS